MPTVVTGLQTNYSYVGNSSRVSPAKPTTKEQALKAHTTEQSSKAFAALKLQKEVEHQNPGTISRIQSTLPDV